MRKRIAKKLLKSESNLSSFQISRAAHAFFRQPISRIIKFNFVSAEESEDGKARCKVEIDCSGLTKMQMQVIDHRFCYLLAEAGRRMNNKRKAAQNG